MQEHNIMNIASMSEDEAREMLEEIRWPNGNIQCPHCKSRKGAYELNGKTTRAGLKKCKKCRKKFTVTVGTVFEGSHIPLNKWLAAVYLMNASKKGISAHQLHRMLDITYKSAWFMCHRIRFAMTEEPLGMLLGIVEADETYVGGKEKNKHANKRLKNARGRSTETKTPVFALVERGGKVRAQKVPNVKGLTLQSIIAKNVHPDTRIMTDEMSGYKGLNRFYTSHETVSHGRKEYVRGDVYTNLAENWFSLLKRGIVGTFHHVSEEHLDRYVQEFQFRHNYRKLEDGERMKKALEGAEGKRLTYRETKG